MSDSKSPARILLVEDDLQLADLVREYLKKRGFEVIIENRGDTAQARCADVRPDLLILDIGLPGMDGLSLCRNLRPSFQGPIIMLTALDEEADEVLGLEVGADDYLCKPVRPRILLARIQSLLRRHDQGKAYEDSLRFGALTISPRAREVRIDNVIIEMTTAEFDLLVMLARNAGTVLSREELATALRGIEHDAFDRSIDLRISRLRKKLGDSPRNSRFIKSIRGVGYLMSPGDLTRDSRTSET